MSARLDVAIERWPVAGSFTIARGAKTHVDVVVVTLTDNGVVGRGEATPIYYHGESAESVAAQLHSGMVLGRGAARNALDCATGDLRAKQPGIPVWQSAGLEAPQPLTTAYTISLGEPDRMRADAAKAAALYPLLKLKLSGEGDIARVAAVRSGAPGARLIVDANEAWTGRDIVAEATALLPFGVELIEQPVRAGDDALLDGLRSPIPLSSSTRRAG